MSYKDSYDICNMHLIESDKKRDQLVAFYMTFVGAYFALSKSDSEIAGFFSIGLVFIGILLSRTILEYRKWHIRYVNSAKVLNHFIIDPDKVSEAGFEELRGNIFQDCGISESNKIITFKFIGRYFKGVESYMYQTFLIVVYIPIHLLLLNLNIGLPNRFDWALIFIGNLILFLLVINSISMFHIYDDFKKWSPYARWVLPIDVPESLFKKKES